MFCYLKENHDALEIVIQSLTLVITSALTYMLVRNDHSRARYDNRERQKKLIKNIFRAAGNYATNVQIAGLDARFAFKDTYLITEAYEELLFEQPQLALPRVSEFLRIMNDIERKLWPTYLEWPPNSASQTERVKHSITQLSAKIRHALRGENKKPDDD